MYSNVLQYIRRRGGLAVHLRRKAAHECDHVLVSCEPSADPAAEQPPEHVSNHSADIIPSNIVERRDSTVARGVDGRFLNCGEVNLACTILHKDGGELTQEAQLLEVARLGTFTGFSERIAVFEAGYSDSRSVIIDLDRPTIHHPEHDADGLAERYDPRVDFELPGYHWVNTEVKHLALFR